MVSKHSAAIKARMRQLGESYYVAREAYLRQQGMPVDPPSQKGARRKAKRQREAAIIAEYGDHLGLDKLPLARPKPSEP